MKLPPDLRHMAEYRRIAREAFGEELVMYAVLATIVIAFLLNTIFGSN